MLGLCFVLWWFVSFLVQQSTRWEERAGCFTLICSECHVVVIIFWLFLAVQQIGLCCVIVVFPGYTHLLSMSFILILNNPPEIPEYA